MKIIVFAYQSIGYEALNYLIRRRAPVLGVVTHRDNPGEKVWWPSVAELAQQFGLNVYYADDMDNKALADLVRRQNPEMIFSFYYRNMIPARILKLARRGGINLHGSLLPKYRGRAPANWVLVNDEPKTGLTLHEMVARADAGRIIAQAEIPIDRRETIKTLYARMIRQTGELLTEWYPRIEQGDYPLLAQDESQATCFGGRRPEDGRIDWRWPTRKIDCLVRAVTDPYPGAFTFLDGRKLIIWDGEAVKSQGGINLAPGASYHDASGKLCFVTSDGVYQINRAT